MAEPTSLDPFSLVRGLVSQLEKGFNEFANPLMKSDGFAQGANKAMSGAMVAKKLVQELTQRYFEALNLPSRSDIVALSDRLQELEDRMINLQATLDRLPGAGGQRPALPGPARTRQPPAALIETAAAAPARKRTRKAKP
jgi:hypothetical protein